MTTGEHRTGFQRRTFVRCACALGVVAGGGVLTACGGDEEPSGASPGTSPTSSDSSTGGNGGGGGGNGGGGGEVLAKAADIPVGGAVIFAEANVIVTQPTEGDFQAFTDTCTHQGNPIQEVGDGIVQCLFHGSEFSIEDGSVVNGPATQPLPTVEIEVRGSDIVLT